MKYINILRVSMKNKMVYNWSVLLDVLIALIAIAVPVYLWRGVYSFNESIYTYMTNYAIVANIIGLVYNIEATDKIADHVKSGLVSYELIRPVNYIFRLFAEDLGAMIVRIFTIVIPMMIVSFFMFDFYIPKPHVFLVFLMLLAFAVVIMFLVHIIVSMLNFWFFEASSFMILLEIAILFLSGRFLPDFLMPDFLKPLLYSTPFILIYQKPAEIYLSMYRDDALNTNFLLQIITQQFLWILALLAIEVILWYAAKRKLVVQGG